MSNVELAVGDLLDQPVEAIVNAWNRNFIPWWLLVPQGVSGAIKRRAGYEPFRELTKFGPLRSGEARLTNAGRLPFRAIIHVAALNLLWRSSPQIIEAGVRNALILAQEQHFESIAVPLLGSGTGGVPKSLSESITLRTARQSGYSGNVIVVVYGRGA